MTDHPYADRDMAYGEPRAPRRRIRYDPTEARGDTAFRDAARHSRRVRWLRIILPALALVAAGAFWGALRIVPGNWSELVSISGIDIESNSVVMDNPLISGFAGTQRSYEVKAANAVQSLADPNIITFNDIDAAIGLDTSGTATVRATIGTFDSNGNTLDLRDGIAMSTTDGYAARLSTAFINLDARTLVSADPIEISADWVKLRANSIRVADEGRRVVFEGGVSVSYLPSSDLLTPAGGAPQP